MSRIPSSQAEFRSQLSHKESEQKLLAGFVCPLSIVGHGDRKVAASRLRTRCIAVRLALDTSPAFSRRELAKAADLSERHVLNTFKLKEGLFAFPPPELAEALVAGTTPAANWGEVIERVRPVFDALQSNDFGQRLLTDLVELHHRFPTIRSSDAYFSTTVDLTMNVSFYQDLPKSTAFVGYFTEGVRAALREWADDPQTPLDATADTVRNLILIPTL
jgi:hypothetical protein